MTDDQKQPAPVSKALPFEIRAALVRAAKIDNPVLRAKTIAEVEQRGRERFPELFRRE